MLRVVIAEDEHLILEELACMIPWKELNLELIGTVNDGIAALELLKAAKTDILITDIRMPGIDGLSVVEEIKSIYNIDCIIISGYQEFDYALKAMHLGAIDYLLKPVDEKVLKNTLLKIIENRKNLQIEALSNQFVNESSNRYVNEIITYIDKNFMNNITTRTLSEYLYISEGYVSKIFSKYMHRHLTEYLNEYRIMKAVELIKNSNRKVYEIAQMVGYNDYRYFSQVFKNITGRTPIEYRNRIK